MLEFQEVTAGRRGPFDLFMSPQDRGNIFGQEKGSSRFGLPLGTRSVSLDLSTKRRRC